jgi:hypothetical protein
MKDWSNKKFTYTFISNSNNVKLCKIHDYLKNLETFAQESCIEITAISRKGKDDFLVHVNCLPGWKI